jgi:hypothetical protein
MPRGGQKGVRCKSPGRANCQLSYPLEEKVLEVNVLDKVCLLHNTVIISGSVRVTLPCSSSATWRAGQSSSKQPDRQRRHFPAAV